MKKITLSLFILFACAQSKVSEPVVSAASTSSTPSSITSMPKTLSVKDWHWENPSIKGGASVWGESTLRDAAVLQDGSVIAAGEVIVKRDPAGRWRKIADVEGLFSIAVNGDTILVAGNKRLLRSQDNGESFSSIPVKTGGAIFSIGGVWFLANVGGSLSRSIDDGDTWQTLIKASKKNYTDTILSLPDGTFLLSGASYNKKSWQGWLKTSPDAKSWETLPQAPSIGFPRILLQRDGTLWLGGSQGELYKTKNPQSLWEKVSSPTNSPIMSIHETSDGMLWLIVQGAPSGNPARGAFYVLWSSADQGASWKQESPPISVCFLKEIEGAILFFEGYSSVVSR
jgi:hypothetical protein